jgi:hypothetical protein
MSDLDHDVAAKLLAIKEKRDSEITQSEPVEETPVNEAVPEQAVEEAVEDVKPTSEPTAEDVPQEKSEDDEIRWDADLEEPSEPVAGVDIKKIGSALELNAATEEELVTQVKERLAKLKELETKSEQTFEGVPTELREAINIAKQGGDWYTFIEHSLLDVTKLDPIDLFEQEYERQEAHKYRNADGTIDYERLDEAMDSIPDAMKSMQGNQIKNSLYLQQQNKKQQVVGQTKQAQEVFQRQLGEAMKELPNFFPTDTFGIKIEPTHATNLYDGIATNKLVQKHLGNIDPVTLSKLDAKKLTRTLAMAEWSAGISKAQYNKGLVQGKKQLLDKTQNVQINSPGRSAEPELGDNEKPLTAAQKLKASLSGFTPMGSL